jgi:SMP-30/Gluconolactonase/LRE-like region
VAHRRSSLTRLVGQDKATLGEGPLWDHRDGRLLWVDIVEGAINVLSPGTSAMQRIELGENVGCLALTGRPRHRRRRLAKRLALDQSRNRRETAHREFPRGDHVPLQRRRGRPRGSLLGRYSRRRREEFRWQAHSSRCRPHLPIDGSRLSVLEWHRVVTFAPTPGRTLDEERGRVREKHPASALPSFSRGLTPIELLLQRQSPGS